jgi:hypothetical protein
MTNRDRRKRTLPAAAGTASYAAGAASGAVKREDIAADYTHIRSDLKRIGLLSVVLIAGLVVLSRFIH